MKAHDPGPTARPASELSSILLFSKVPGLAPVKTRLLRDSQLPREVLDELIRAIFADSLALCDVFPHRVSFASEPMVSLEDLHGFLSSMPYPPRLSELRDPFLFPQLSASFAERLGGALDSLLSRERGAGVASNGVLILGSDSPTIPVPSLSAAIQQIETGSAVLGPCFDGGVYLIGLPQKALTHAEMFQGCFGRDAQTEVSCLAQAFRKRDIPVHLLPYHSDIDVTEDLAHLFYLNELDELGVQALNHSAARNTRHVIKKYSLRLIRDTQNNRSFRLVSSETL